MLDPVQPLEYETGLFAEASRMTSTIEQEIGKFSKNAFQINFRGL